MKYKPNIFCDWGLKSELEFDKQVEIFVDKFSYTKIPNDTIRIIIIQEPYSYELINIVLDSRYNDLFTYVFTYHQQVLDNSKKAIHFLGINTWIKNYQFPVKKFSVSTLVGGKTRPTLEGLDYRHILWNRQNEIKIPKDFYLSSQFPYAGANYYNSLFYFFLISKI